MAAITAMYVTRMIPIVAAFVFCSCEQKASVTTLFEKLNPKDTNIFFENTVVEDTLFNSLNYLYFYDGGGVAVGDINNDGLADIYFTANMTINRLYLNQGNFKFADITETAGVSGGTDGWTTGATMADINGDGFLDIYVCRSNYLDRTGANQLFINNGNLTFAESAEEYGLAHRGLCRQAAVFDYDLDGDLDMYLMNHSVHSKRTYGEISELRKVIDEAAGDKLFRNDAGHFTNVTTEAGIYENILGYGLGVAIGDLNQDGFPDIYISNDFHEDDYLYYNNGDGTFTEGMRASMGHVSLASMGNDMADFDNDGLLDMVVLDMLPEKEAIRKSSVSADPFEIYDVKQQYGYYHQLRRNTLQLNRGPVPDQRAGAKTSPCLFSEIGQFAGIHATDWSWAPLIVDLNNDGHKDLFISNGIFRRANDLDYLAYIKQPETRAKVGMQNPATNPLPIRQEVIADIVGHMPSEPQANYVFASQGDLTFRNRAAAWGLDDPGFSNGAAYADFDNDGAMDLVVNNVNAPATIYRNLLNQTGNDPADGQNGSSDNLSAAGNYLKVRLAGGGHNVFGIGAKVILYYGDRVFYQELMPTRGFQSSVEPVLNFGLGNVVLLDSLEVIWPTGEAQVLKYLSVNRAIVLEQANATPVQRYPFGNEDEAVFRDVTEEIELSYKHDENVFVEYNREPFIPHFLSTEGPAFAVRDVDGDGLEDLFLGGAKHQQSGIYLQRPQGGFKAVINPAFENDSGCEDVDAVFFYADTDRLPDLYVVSGGNEFFGRAEELRDRLYINQGGGRFRKAEGAIPEIYANGSCVEPADLDGDGDIDLFVGSRSVPRQYGVIPESYLLMNDGNGTFTDVTSSDLSKAGMVTDAEWVDLNRDGRTDLVVVGEWMPVTIFQNQEGKLTNMTEHYGLQNTQGWWNTIATADFNGDGASDLVAGNLGLNSILKANDGEPVQLFINDYSGNGRLDQILTYYHDGRQYPLPSYDLMSDNMPSFRHRYPRYRDYGGVAFQDIFSKEQLQNSETRTASEFASILLMNVGASTFDVIQLPAAVQFSPVYAILVDDFTHDGHLDILLGGNFSGVQPDQGRYDASYGTLLIGDGRGEFTAASLQESGFIVSGEVRGMKSVKAASGATFVLCARNNDTVVIKVLLNVD
jgi:hypothetical protein